MTTKERLEQLCHEFDGDIDCWNTDMRLALAAYNLAVEDAARVARFNSYLRCGESVRESVALAIEQLKGKD